MQALLDIIPKAIYVATPSHFNLTDVGRHITCACFTTFGELCDPLVHVQDIKQLKVCLMN